jgi:hypothetical protein
LGMGMVLALTRLRYGYRNESHESERGLA